jgi:predicted acyl esterase
VEVPVYLGCDWQNVPLHLPHTFKAFERLANSQHVQVAILDVYGLTWPWESLHVEALAWFDHWLKGRDTGILDGPRIRYTLPGTDGWRTSDVWPVAEAEHRAFALRADGVLGELSQDGSRTLLTLGAGLNRPVASETDPPASLVWDTTPLAQALDLVGEIELALDASATASDTAWIAVLQDVSPAGVVTDITQGYLRASLREVDETISRPGCPILPCRTFQAVPIGERVQYRIPIVANAHRFDAGHRVRLLLTSDDQDVHMPAMLAFRHASVGTSCMSQIHASSRLLLPIVPTR